MEGRDRAFGSIDRRLQRVKNNRVRRSSDVVSPNVITDNQVPLYHHCTTYHCTIVRVKVVSGPLYQLMYSSSSGGTVPWTGWSLM